MRLAPLALSALMGLSLGADTQQAGAKAPAKAAPDPKRVDIVRLLKVLNWPAANSEAARKQIEAASKDPKFGAFPAAYWKDYEAAATPEAFEKILLPLFDKTYSHDEVKALLRLMATPEFKLFLEKNPDAMLRKDAYEGYSKYMTEVGGKLREKHKVVLPAPAKK